MIKKQFPEIVCAFMAILLFVSLYEYIIAKDDVAAYFIEQRQLYYLFGLAEGVIFQVISSRTKTRYKISFFIGMGYLLGITALFIFPKDLHSHELLSFCVGLTFIARWASIK